MIKSAIRTRSDGTFTYDVSVQGRNFTVHLNTDYWQELTDRRIGPQVLIEKSFEYLLSKESAEEILSEFNLADIREYFPTYESDIKKRLAATIES